MATSKPNPDTEVQTTPADAVEANATSVDDNASPAPSPLELCTGCGALLDEVHAHYGHSGDDDGESGDRELVNA